MHIDMKRIGEIIRDARKTKGITQKVLAEQIETSLRTVIDIEKGHRNPTLETISSIIQVLNIPADAIFRPDKQQNTPEQEQFIQEFLDAEEQGQRLSMAASRSIWRELSDDNL